MKPQVMQLEDRCCPSVYVVTNLLDSGPGSLRAAVLLVNQDAGTGIGDTISIPVAGVINLNTPLVVTHHCNVIGPGEDLLTINGQGITRVWDIYPPNAQNGSSDESAYLTVISGMTIENAFQGQASALGGAAVFGRENICLVDMCFEDCNSTSQGGAVGGLLEIMIKEDMFQGNTASKKANSIFLGAGQTLDMVDSVFQDYQNFAPVTAQGTSSASLPQGFPINEIVW